jgi:type I restriction enzyme R subunit
LNRLQSSPHQQQDYVVLHCYTEEPETLPDETGRSNKKQVVLPRVLFESLCRNKPGYSR